MKSNVRSQNMYVSKFVLLIHMHAGTAKIQCRTLKLPQQWKWNVKNPLIKILN